MSWDATIFGTLTMPAGEFGDWLGRTVDSANVPDAGKFLSTSEVNGKTVEERLLELESFKDEEGVGFIEIKRDATVGRIEVRSFLSKDEYLDHGVILAAVWAAAEKGASGELYFAGMLTASFCYKLTVGPKGVTLKALKDGAADKLPTYQEIEDDVEARIAELDL